MPYRPYEIRVEKYDKAIIPDNVAAKFTALKDLMISQQEARQSEIVTFEGKVRAKLDDEGILGNFRIPYLNFARALYRALGHQSGLAVQKIATAEKAKFVALGCDAEILSEIVLFVIGVAEY